MKKKRISLSVTEDTERRLALIPEGLRSTVIRSLLRAYEDLRKRTSKTIALGAVMTDDITLNLKENKGATAKPD